MGAPKFLRMRQTSRQGLLLTLTHAQKRGTLLIVYYQLIVMSFAFNNLVPFPQILTNKFERNLKIGAQRSDRKLGHTLNAV